MKQVTDDLLRAACMLPIGVPYRKLRVRDNAMSVYVVVILAQFRLNVRRSRLDDHQRAELFERG